MSLLRRLSLSAVSNVWSLAWLWCILNICALVCLWNETSHYFHQNQGPRNLCLGNILWALAFAALLGKGAQCTETEKGSSTRAQWSWAYCKQVRQPQSTMLVAAGCSVFVLGVGVGEWCRPYPLFLQRSLYEHCLSGTHYYEKSKQSPHCVPKEFYWLLFPCCISQYRSPAFSRRSANASRLS